MIIKGGDVEQLITTPYVQPYVQIVCSSAHCEKIQEADQLSLAVLYCDAEHIREYRTNGAYLCPFDVWHYQSGHYHFEAAMVICSRRRIAMEPLVESCPPRYV